MQEGHPRVVDDTALKYDIPCITTLSGVMSMAEGIAALTRDGLSVRSLQEIHGTVEEG